MKENTHLLIDQLSNVMRKYQPQDYPFISIVIPTRNSAQTIGLSIDSVLRQDYPSYELIIVDSSDDRTLEIVKSFNSSKIHIYSVTQCSRYEMVNKGLSQASGEYINFLFPGDFYISYETIKQMMALALEKNKPDLVYSGTLLREGRGSEAKVLFRHLDIESLKKGLQPTSLQSCWFKTSVVRNLGKFNPRYKMRGGFDLMCRFCLDKNLHFISLKRILTDYDLRLVTREMVTDHFFETMKTIYRYFGLFTTLKWLLFYQRDSRRIVKLWLRSMRIAFSGR